MSAGAWAQVTIAGRFSPPDPPAVRSLRGYRDAVTGEVRTVTDGRLDAGAPGRGDLRVYVLNGPGKIGADGPYPK